MMRHITFDEPGTAEVLQLAEREAPVAGPGEVLIQVAAAGVNRPDIMQRLGLYPPPPGASDILGLEVAGTVLKVGQGVTQWAVGDDVCALCNGGGYAELVNVPADQCLPVPEGLSMVEAAALPETFFTVWSNVFDRGRLRAGENFLIHGGTSGIGVAAIQMARVMGATVFATAGSDEKCTACLKLGADHAINYKTEDFVERCMKLSGGKGIDVILDMVGGDYIQRNYQVAALDARIVNIAFQQGFQTEVNFMPIMLKRLTHTGSTLRPQSGEAKAAIANALRETIWPKIACGDIKPVIEKVFRLSQAPEAHALMESSRHIGKIMLEVGSKG
ncbi:MAG: NAD(P)H-quinone oxidoreductase [Gammaproteobacteria bacterium]|nr:NAD(P)H-quinone oxidoreductase [Gammaproteobacteria bacterium]